MRWGVVPCCVGTAELLVGTSPHPPPAGAPSPQREGFAGSSVSVSGPGGGPLPSPGGEGGLRRLTEAGGRMRGESSLAALERQRNLSGRHLIRPLRGHLPLKGKAALCCSGLNEGARRIIGTTPHPPQCAHWGTFPSRGRLCGGARLSFRSCLSYHKRRPFAFPWRGRWTPASHGSRRTDEVGCRPLLRWNGSAAYRDATSSAPCGGTFPSRGRLCGGARLSLRSCLGFRRLPLWHSIWGGKSS